MIASNYLKTRKVKPRPLNNSRTGVVVGVDNLISAVLFSFMFSVEATGTKATSISSRKLSEKA